MYYGLEALPPVIRFFLAHSMSASPSSSGPALSFCLDLVFKQLSQARRSPGAPHLFFSITPDRVYFQHTGSVC
jgi:hypothetical protein